MRIIKTSNYFEWISFYKENPAQFLEDYFNIGFNEYQKTFIDKLVKIKSLSCSSRRKNCYGYIQLLIILLNMEEDDHITIISPNEEKSLNRDQLIDYIEEFKNQHLKR